MGTNRWSKPPERRNDGLELALLDHLAQHQPHPGYRHHVSKSPNDKALRMGTMLYSSRRTYAGTA